MAQTTAGVKARTPKSLNNDGLSNMDQPMAEGTEAVRDFAKQGAAYSKDAYEKAKAIFDETNKELSGAIRRPPRQQRISIGNGLKCCTQTPTPPSTFAARSPE